ncbi:MAG: MBL fold metallo-hydrolase [Gammaproteobacteria bacterium]|nr:MBL fold metallo-hydrolase [Gammaproteobacteria bacterium]MDH5303527.1 MBL fold metallo-hydrolase [Gammaproteobacteria bacterium]MDH5321869.1 MBL fold metallo-hydrolase [Gammaproteobacteria bacterium]
MSRNLNTIIGMVLAAGVMLAAAPAPGQSQRAAGLAHIEAARHAAKYDNAVLFDHTCARLLVGADLPFGRIPRPIDDRDPANYKTDPVRVFDNLYYVGEKLQWGATPSAWAVVTSEGIILIDTMFEDSMHDLILGGFEKLGLDPADIKTILLTHGHSDHVGGARYLQENYHPKVIMGGPDWDQMEQSERFRGPKPARDASAVDGQKLTLGDTTISIFLTPGHTPGTISLLIPVTDNGTPHLAALWGGTGMQYDAAEYSKQAARFRGIVAEAGADVILSTHPQLDNSDVKLPLVKKRRSGDPNPYVVGNQVVEDYLTVAHECAAAATLMPDEYAAYLGR